MKLVENLPPGAADRIGAAMLGAARGEKSTAFTLALAVELVAKMQAEFAALRAEIADRQKSLADQYAGAWRIDQQYQRNALATHRGSLWLALADTDNEPGHGPTWKLISKNGSAPQ